MTTTRTLIALQMPFQDSEGDAHPQSVWIPSAVTEDIIDEAGGIPFIGFSSAATLQAHDTPCGQHNTQVGRADFIAGSQETDVQVAAALGMPATGITEAQNTAYLCIGFALSAMDTPVLNPDKTPVLNPDDTPKMQSFFAGATIVSVTATDGD